MSSHNHKKVVQPFTMLAAIVSLISKMFYYVKVYSSRNYLSIIAEANIDFDSDDDMILHKHDITYFFKRIKKTSAFLWRLIHSTFKQCSLMLRYLNFKPSFKLPWCRTQDLFGSQIPVTTGGFQLQISCIGSSYLTH